MKKAIMFYATTECTLLNLEKVL